MNADELAIKAHLRTYPRSSTPSIGLALDMPNKKIAGILGRCSGIHKECEASGKLLYSLAEDAPVVAAQSQAVEPRENQRNLIDELVALIAAPIRAKFESELASIAPTLIKNSIRELNGRVMRELGERFRVGSLVQADVFVDPASPSRDPAPVTPKKPEAKKPAIEISTDLPVGSFQPNDPVSRRTAHNPRNVVVQKTTAVGQSAIPQKNPRPQKIIVVGLHDNKQELIRREFRDKFDLRLYNADQVKFLRKAINPGDIVLCMADYISHMHTDVVSAEGGQSVIVHGGVPSLRDELDERYEAFMTDRKAA